MLCSLGKTFRNGLIFPVNWESGGKKTKLFSFLNTLNTPNIFDLDYRQASDLSPPPPLQPLKMDHEVMQSPLFPSMKQLPCILSHESMGS